MFPILQIQEAANEYEDGRVTCGYPLFPLVADKEIVMALGNRGPQDGGSSLSPLQILHAARKAVPAVDYALGVAGIAAAGAIVTMLIGQGKTTIIIIGGLFIAMLLLFIFSRLTVSKSRSITLAGYFLTWTVLAFFVTFLAFTASAVAIGRPVIWAQVLGLLQSKNPVDELEARIDYGNIGVNQDAIASLVGIASLDQDDHRDPRQVSAIVQVLKRKLEYPESGDFDTPARAIRKALFEGLLKIRNRDIHSDFPSGELESLDVVGLDAKNANLEGLSFKNAFIIGTDFSSSNLHSTNFTSASLRGDNFSNAHLDGAVFAKADWFNARGITAAQINTIDRADLLECPKGPDGAYSIDAFKDYANQNYGVPFDNWADLEQHNAIRFWSEYMKSGGVCDLVRSFS